MRIFVNGSHSKLSVTGLVAGMLGIGALGGSPVTYAQSTGAQNAAAEAPPQSADADLTARVKQALHSDRYLDDRHITVGMSSGDVVLKGFVQSQRDLLAAAEIATKVAGSRKIVNRLSIEQSYRNSHGP